MLEQLGSVLGFVWKEVLSSNETLAALVGQAMASPTLPFLSHLVDTIMLLMPKTEADLAGFQKLLEKSCRDFECKLAGFGAFGKALLAGSTLSR